MAPYSIILPLGCCLLSLTGCSERAYAPPAHAADKLDDQSSLYRADALTPPEQPALVIQPLPQSLLLSWDANSAYQHTNIYRYDAVTGQEMLVRAELSSDKNTLQLPSITPLRAWHTQSFRAEFCNADECVSSTRMSVESLAADTMQTLRPGVFLNGERFADKVAVSHDGRVVFASLPIASAIQIYFHNQQRWIATEPVGIDNVGAMSITDIASADDGDTLAVLLLEQTASPKAAIQLVERLGEAWFPTTRFSLPDQSDSNTGTRLSLSDDAHWLLLDGGEHIAIYKRQSLDWIAQTVPDRLPGTRYRAVAQGINAEQLHVLEQIGDALWLVTYRLDSTEQTEHWTQTQRFLVQGIDAHDELFLEVDKQGSTIMIAGWDNSIRDERSPALLRLNAFQSPASSTLNGVELRDSIRSAPTTHASASLRFSTNSALDTVVLGWQSEQADDARLNSFVFDETLRQWLGALALPDATPTLAKQGFATEVKLSGDGSTLLVSVPAGQASSVDNRVGELLVIR